jgi:hypothetical protein
MGIDPYLDGREKHCEKEAHESPAREDAMEALLKDLETAVGADGVATGEEAAEQAFSPWARLGKPLAIVRPRRGQA